MDFITTLVAVLWTRFHLLNDGSFLGDGTAVCIKLVDDIFRTMLHHRSLSQEDVASKPTKTAWDKYVC